MCGHTSFTENLSALQNSLTPAIVSFAAKMASLLPLQLAISVITNDKFTAFSIFIDLDFLRIIMWILSLLSELL